MRVNSLTEGNNLEPLSPSFSLTRGESSQYLSSMADSRTSIYSHKTSSIRTNELTSIRMSHRASLFESTQEEATQDNNVSVVDLTWFQWLGGLMADDAEQSLMEDDVADNQSVDLTSYRWLGGRIHEGGEEEEGEDVTDNRFVDLTWYRYLGGLMGNEGSSSDVETSSTTHSHRVSNNSSSPRHPVSLKASTISNNNSSYASLAAPPTCQLSTESEPSENPHAVDLTWFLWLGGMVQAPPQFNSERPESFDDNKAPWDEETTTAPPKRGFMMSIRKVLRTSTKTVPQDDTPEAAHSPKSSLSREPSLPSLSEGRSVTPEQVENASAGRLMGIFKRTRDRVFQVNSNRASAISIMRKENIATQDLMLVEHFAAWFSKLGVALVRPDHFCEDLEDGVVLLTLLEQVPGAKIGKFYKSPKDFARFGEFRKRENIQKFAKVGRSVGLRGDVFTYTDLHQRSLHKVIPTLIELAGIVFHQGFDLAAYMPKELRESSSALSLGPLPVS